MRFSEIPYRRADLAAWKALVEDLTARFLAAGTFEEADAVYREAQTSQEEYDTMVTLARIRRDIDTRDPFYDGEVEYYDREMPNLQGSFQAWTDATLHTPFRKELEEKYGSVPFLNAEIEARTFQPEIVEELQKENALFPGRGIYAESAFSLEAEPG